MITTMSELFELYLSPMPNRKLVKPKAVVCRGRFQMTVVSQRGTVFSTAAQSRRRFRYLDSYEKRWLLDTLRELDLVSADVVAEYDEAVLKLERQREAASLLRNEVPELEGFGVKLTKAQRAKLATAARKP